LRKPRLLAAAALLAAVPAQAADKLGGGGDGTFYYAGRPNKIFILDEATLRPAGAIELKHGLATSLTLSQDRQRFYARMWDMERIEVVDIARRQVVDSFSLSEGNKKVRIMGAEPDPTHRFVVLLTRTATKQVDRWEIGPPTLQQYDLQSRKVVRTIPWPKGEEREGVQMLFSPDGKFLYFFSEDVLIYETQDFTQADKWELSRPLEEGMGRIDLGALDILNEVPGFFSGIFSVQDPVQHRRIMGVARVNLLGKSVDFFTVGPSTSLSFALAPGRKKAYALHQEIGKYEFWAFDLEGRRLIGKTEFPGRPRMSLKVSSNGRLLYIYRAGNTLDLYEAATYKHLGTHVLEAELTGDLFLMPRQPAGSPAR
jgi:hypothetical protein